MKFISRGNKKDKKNFISNEEKLDLGVDLGVEVLGDLVCPDSLPVVGVIALVGTVIMAIVGIVVGVVSGFNILKNKIKGK